MQKGFSFGKLTQKNIDALASIKQTLGWQIDQFGIPQIWQQTKGAGVKVAVIDSVVDIKHQDVTICGGFDFVTNSPLSPTPPNIAHGTHVCGIIGAKNNTIGIVGVAPECRLYSCAVVDDSGRGSFENIITAIDWCISNKMDVINISLGAEVDDSEFYRAIRRAYDANIPIICAAGNSSWERGYLDFPATYNETIAVSAMNSDMVLSDFSSIGPNIDVCAPGEDILSCIPANRYAYMSGTSMAAPFVTGVVALLIAKHRRSGGNTPVNTVEDVREHLIKTAKDIYYTGRDDYSGYGIINPNSSLGWELTTGISSLDQFSVKGVSSPFYKIRTTFTQSMSISSVPLVAAKYRKYLTDKAIPVQKGDVVDLLFTLDDIKRAVKSSKKYVV